MRHSVEIYLATIEREKDRVRLTARAFAEENRETAPAVDHGATGTTLEVEWARRRDMSERSRYLERAAGWLIYTRRGRVSTEDVDGWSPAPRSYSARSSWRLGAD
jgi:hypothetical protein